MVAVATYKKDEENKIPSPPIPTTNPHPNKKIEHTTVIDAPVEAVWKALVDTNDWSWNQWTRLDTSGTAPVAGLQGTLKACYEGNDQDWQSFPFEFAEVDYSEKQHVLAWKGKVLAGILFSGYHTMRLEPITTLDSETQHTKLIHTEIFGGLLPMLKLGLPYPKLDRNYRLMNESLKKHVEETSKNQQ